MSYTTNQLISGAYYAAGVVSREFETVNGSQMSDGLQWLNDVLSDKDADQAMLPYEDSLVFNAVEGKEVYFLPNIVQIDTLVFYLDQVRYAMQYTKRNEYFGSSRVQNVQTLPFQWYFERKYGGGNLYIYFKPDRNYPIEIHGTFRLQNVSLNQDLTSNSTTFNLGIAKVYGTGELDPGDLLINNFDMQGFYSNSGAFVNYINSGIIPGVRAFLDNLNEIVLNSIGDAPIPIHIETRGHEPNGTVDKGVVKVATTSSIINIYQNGNNGVGATIFRLTTGVFTVDGYATQLGDRILVKDQSTGFEFQNGIYIVTTAGAPGVSAVLTRASNFDTSGKMPNGSLITVTSGTLNGGKTFVLNSNVYSVGTDEIGFKEFNAITFANFSTIQFAHSDLFSARAFDQFYISYLRYALADRIRSEYNYDTPMNVQKQLSEYIAWIKKKSRIIDLQMQKVSTLQNRGSLNYGFINLGKGWTPS